MNKETLKTWIEENGFLLILIAVFFSVAFMIYFAGQQKTECLQLCAPQDFISGKEFCELICD